jgi:SAM-dependent methyltransferase
LLSHRPGFKRDELGHRYDVGQISEDDWHSYSGQAGLACISKHLSSLKPPSDWLLNGGSGVYALGLSDWKEVALDLFATPIRRRPYPVCASVDQLPFASGVFGGVVCIGEVLGYCDPAKAIAEFARVLSPKGMLICDFRSSRGFRNWFSSTYGRAADLVIDEYNRSPERTWVYDPSYIHSLLRSSGFHVNDSIGIHTWSALARRLGISVPTALSLQRKLGWIKVPSAWADLTTVVAGRI